MGKKTAARVTGEMNEEFRTMPFIGSKNAIGNKIFLVTCQRRRVGTTSPPNPFSKLLLIYFIPQYKSINSMEWGKNTKNKWDIEIQS